MHYINLRINTLTAKTKGHAISTYVAHMMHFPATVAGWKILGVGKGMHACSVQQLRNESNKYTWD